MSLEGKGRCKDSRGSEGLQARQSIYVKVCARRLLQRHLGVGEDNFKPEKLGETGTVVRGCAGMKQMESEPHCTDSASHPLACSLISGHCRRRPQACFFFFSVAICESELVDLHRTRHLPAESQKSRNQLSFGSGRRQESDPDMSSGIELGSDHLCYVHCNFCNTILAVSVPCSSLFKIVTVRCGHCTNLLSVNMAGLLQTLPHQAGQQTHNVNTYEHRKDWASSSTCNSDATMISSTETEEARTSSTRQPEKRQRVPSAYNRFIKEEIQRIKASNPDISHKEAFSTAAKNWAHFPHIHFGLMLESHRQARIAEMTSLSQDISS
eukprot:Gb_36880 [translate_table: standard]